MQPSVATRTAFSHALLVLLVLGTLQAAHGQGSSQVRASLPVPDLPGYKTLKGDFHIHIVFSDGRVWPTVRVMEAWRDGLDVISLTDHADHHPHAEDVKVDGTRSYALARPLAEQLGLILIPGVEITKTLEHGPTHFNALFVTDPNALNVPDLFEALRRARTQDAFVFWNHPEWRVPRPKWFPPIAAAHQQKLFQGMELVNGYAGNISGANFYASAYPWIEEKKLTILCTSDVHDPMPPRAAGGIRPITLLFVHTADVAGVREALFARRTAAWMGGQVWGAEQFLRGLWQAAVRVENPELSYRSGTRLVLRVHNNSAIPFHFRIRQAPAWFGIETNVIAAEGTSLLFPYITSEAPEGSQSLELELELTNLHIGPGRNLSGARAAHCERLSEVKQRVSLTLLGIGPSHRSPAPKVPQRLAAPRLTSAGTWTYSRLSGQVADWCNGASKVTENVGPTLHRRYPARAFLCRPGRFRRGPGTDCQRDGTAEATLFKAGQLLRQLPEAPVGIAEAAAPKKRIPLSSRKGELSQKGGSGSRANGLWGLENGGWKPVGPSGRKFCARRARLVVTGYILVADGEPKSLFCLRGLHPP